MASMTTADGKLAIRQVISARRISAAVRRLATEINREYADRELHLVIVLKGAFIFAADLVRQLQVPVTMDFIQLGSYQGTTSSGSVAIIRDLTSHIAGRDVLVVEEILDTGFTLSFLLGELRSRAPRSLATCVLIDKQERRRVAIHADFVGIDWHGGFLVGYGLDLEQRYRELPVIGELHVGSPVGGMHDHPV